VLALFALLLGKVVTVLLSAVASLALALVAVLLERLGRRRTSRALWSRARAAVAMLDFSEILLLPHLGEDIRDIEICYLFSLQQHAC
jgi:hypothetical protein